MSRARRRMYRMRRRHNNRNDIKRLARRTKQYLAALIILLIAIVLALALRLGQDVWPAPMIEHRTQIIGVMLLALVAIICWFPVIVEANSNPQPFSGPGKNPELEREP